jgi:hypothetical protein
MGEPAATPAPPKTRRRRWLIAALVLLLLSVAWWRWPRVDARFVGKWLHSSPSVFPQKGFTLVLDPDGT